MNKCKVVLYGVILALTVFVVSACAEDQICSEFTYDTKITYEGVIGPRFCIEVKELCWESPNLVTKEGVQVVSWSELIHDWNSNNSALVHNAGIWRDAIFPLLRGQR